MSGMPACFFRFLYLQACHIRHLRLDRLGPSGGALSLCQIFPEKHPPLLVLSA